MNKATVLGVTAGYRLIRINTYRLQDLGIVFVVCIV